MSDDRQLFKVSPGPDGSTLLLAGELDGSTVPQLLDALSTLNGGSEITLGLAGLTFIDSSGLHAIGTYARSREPAGAVKLTDVSPKVRLLLEITGLTDVRNLRIHERA